MSESGNMGSQTGSGSMVIDSGSESDTGSQAMLADGSYLAGLAMGASTRTLAASVLHSGLLFAVAALSLCFLQL